MEELPKDFQSALNETSINSGKDKPSKERFKNQPMEDRIKELLKESTLELAEMVTLKEIELKTERESRREEHGKQQEVIREWQTAFERQVDHTIAVINNYKLLGDIIIAREKRIKELEAELLAEMKLRQDREEEGKELFHKARELEALDKDGRETRDYRRLLKKRG
jgi:hypothetical protein